MRSAKQVAMEVRDGLPDDATFEEVHYRLYVRERVERGQEDARQGRVLSHEQVEKRLARLRGK